MRLVRSSLHSVLHLGDLNLHDCPLECIQLVRCFKKKVAEIIEGISSVRNSQDDILVWGRNKNEHDATLNEVLQRILDSGLRLNRDKCKFGVNELIFLGHVISKMVLKLTLPR